MKHIQSFSDFVNERSSPLLNEAREISTEMISDRIEAIGYSNGIIEIKDVKTNDSITLYSGDGFIANPRNINSVDSLFNFLKKYKEKKYK